MKELIKRGVQAGVIGGILFMIFQMIMTPLFGGGLSWKPLSMIAAMVLGHSAALPPANFDITVVTIGLLIHLGLSIVFGTILGLFISRLSKVPALIIGVIFGLLLYLINFYTFTAVWPWFSEARNWITVTSHLLYGAMTSYAFVRLRTQIYTARTI